MRTVRSAGRSKAVLRTLLLWLLVFVLVEVALALLDASSTVLVLAGAAVLAVGAFDVLRDVAAMPLVAGIVAGAIAIVGVFMALDEADIAPRILNTLFLGLVLAAAGIAIVAIGGGGIQPMRARWEQALARFDAAATTSRLQRDQRQREVDLRDRATQDTSVGVGDDTTLVPTQDRIRAEIRSDTTLP